MDSFNVKVENWLIDNGAFVNNDVFLSNCGPRNIMKKDCNISNEKLEDEESLQSVDTAKYILSNNKKTKTKITTMTIKKYCYLSSQSKSSSTLTVRRNTSDPRKLKSYSHTKQNCTLSPIYVKSLSNRKKRRKHRPVEFNSLDISSSSEDDTLVENSKKRLIKKNNISFDNAIPKKDSSPRKLRNMNKKNVFHIKENVNRLTEKY